MKNARLAVVCVICRPWGQAEPNCGHGWVDGVLMPSLWFTPTWTMVVEVGARAAQALQLEDEVGRFYRDEYLDRLLRSAA